MAPEHDELSEELLLPLPAHRWGILWFGALHPTRVRLYFDPPQLRFWFTDANGRRLSTDRCETLGGEQVVAAKDRLVQVQRARMTITGRHSHHASVPADQTTPSQPAPPVIPTTGAGVATTPDGQLEVAPFSALPPEPPPPQTATARTTSVFKPRKTRAVDIIARVKHTDRIKRTTAQDGPPDPFGSG